MAATTPMSCPICRDFNSQWSIIEPLSISEAFSVITFFVSLFCIIGFMIAAVVMIIIGDDSATLHTLNYKTCAYTACIIAAPFLYSFFGNVVEFFYNFFVKGLIGTTVVYSRDESGNFHKHKGPDSPYGEFARFRIGGSFRSVGALSSERKSNWKIVSSWSGTDFLLEDQHGERIGWHTLRTPDALYRLTAEYYLEYYMEKNLKKE